MRKRYVSLELRTARNLALLAAVLILGVGLLFAPRWIMEGRLHRVMQQDGLTGRGELLWRGQVASIFGPACLTVLEEDGQIYAGRLETYEGRLYTSVYRCETDGEPAVTLTLDNTYTSGNNRVLFQLMALGLPEEVHSGRLAVDLGPGDVRTVDGQRERGVIMFPVPRRDGEQVPHEASYTVTLWDEFGTEVERTGRQLESLWR